MELPSENSIRISEYYNNLLSRVWTAEGAPPEGWPDLEKSSAEVYVEVKQALVRHVRYMLKTLGPDALNDLLAVVAILDLAREAVRLNEMIESALKTSDLSTYEEKRELAKRVNAGLRTRLVWIQHPDTHRACVLYAIADNYGGKFVLEDKETQKRSKTTRDIKDLMPIILGSTSRYLMEWDS